MQIERVSKQKLYIFVVIGILVSAGIVFGGIYIGHAITQASYKVRGPFLYFISSENISFFLSFFAENDHNLKGKYVQRLVNMLKLFRTHVSS